MTAPDLNWAELGAWLEARGLSLRLYFTKRVCIASLTVAEPALDPGRVWSTGADSAAKAVCRVRELYAREEGDKLVSERTIDAMLRSARVPARFQ